MKHVSILIPYHVNLAGLENPRQGLTETNEYLKSIGQQPFFTVELVGLEKEIHTSNGLYAVRTDKLISEIQQTDLIIIPPVSQNIQEAITQNQGFYPWIAKQHAQGSQVMSLCLGAFLLACTGLLDGKKCVTHWRAADQFRQLFPQIDLVSDKLMTDEEGIYTGGGAFSSANLILYIIEKMVNREAAIYCSKIFQIDAGRTSQSPFIIFKAQKSHNDNEIKKAQDFIEKNFSETLSVEELSDFAGLGKRTFERRFKKATANTVREYIQRIKIEAAKKSFESGFRQVNEVMFEVGYNDPKAFRDVFRKVTGLTPTDYRQRFMK